MRNGARMTLDEVSRLPAAIRGQVEEAIRQGRPAGPLAAIAGDLPTAAKSGAWRAAPRISESKSQQAVIAWWALMAGRWRLPQGVLMGFPLQGCRTSANGRRLKAEGMRQYRVGGKKFYWVLGVQYQLVDPVVLKRRIAQHPPDTVSNVLPVHPGPS